MALETSMNDLYGFTPTNDEVKSALKTPANLAIVQAIFMAFAMGMRASSSKTNEADQTVRPPNSRWKSSRHPRGIHRAPLFGERSV
jgi:hypothetical protein